MVNNKIFQFSCALMWGYKVEIDLDDCDTLDDIIIMAKASLNSFLEANNLLVLHEKVNKINYHIHNVTIQDVKNGPLNIHDKVHGYICDPHKKKHTLNNSVRSRLSDNDLYFILFCNVFLTIALFTFIFLMLTFIIKMGSN